MIYEKRIMDDIKHSEVLLPHLAVCITFFYDKTRLPYLSKISSKYKEFSAKVDLYIITNQDDPVLIEQIREVLPERQTNVTVHFIVPRWLGHPYLLTWVHREVFQEIIKNQEVSHFLYSEDDLFLTSRNIAYWLQYRPILRKYGLIPSFFRVEKHPDGGWRSTDCVNPVRINRRQMVTFDRDCRFICLPYPYQGMYFLDRELMDEFAASAAMSPDFTKWMIREKAAAGLTFVNIPRGFTSRNAVPFYNKQKLIKADCWVHHLPNNYANDPSSLPGNLPVETPGLLLSSFEYFRWCLRKKVTKISSKMMATCKRR